MITTINAAGGLALFLLAMSMMTDGLKVFGGNALKAALQRWTTSPWRGAATGVLVTALVQSSSAVTVATIGFVNASMLNLPQALSVVFGANVGTTATGWLVSLIGFGFKIELMALPLLALGVALKMLARSKNIQGLGAAIAGFALFFLGLSILKESFSDVADLFGPRILSGVSGGIVFALIGGFLATVLTQSSSAAVALILTAASESVIGFPSAAAAIIGANVGTTSTAFFAAFAATPNAKRVALGHIAFNVLTGLIAILLLSPMIWLTEWIVQNLGMDSGLVVRLALFHSVFNVLGLFVFLPFVGQFATRLDRRFRTQEDDLMKPQHIDRTTAVTADVAISAIEAELTRLSALVGEIAQKAARSAGGRNRQAERQVEAILHLGTTIDEFATKLRMEEMSKEAAESLPNALRIGRYLQEAVQLSIDLYDLRQESAQLNLPEVTQAIQKTLDHITETLALEEGPHEDEGALDSAYENMEAAYQDAKHVLLRNAVAGRLDIEQTDRILDLLSHTRRLVRQVRKANRLLRAVIAGRGASILQEPGVDERLIETEPTKAES